MLVQTVIPVMGDRTPRSPRNSWLASLGYLASHIPKKKKRGRLPIVVLGHHPPAHSSELVVHTYNYIITALGR